MPKLGRTTPCAWCPWLRKSIPGYLGEDYPVNFYRQSVTLERTPASGMPCHAQVDYGDEDWENQLGDVDLCAGNLIHLNNNLKRPRDPRMAAAVDAVGTSPHVFKWAHEFLAHHMPGASEEAVRIAAMYAGWPFPQDGEDKYEKG